MSNDTALLKEADQTITEHGDGDDGDDGLEIDFVEDDAPAPLCTWSNDPDEHRRAYVVRLMADPNIEDYILIRNMDAVYKWLKDGTILPNPNKQLRRSNPLRPISDNPTPGNPSNSS